MGRASRAKREARLLSASVESLVKEAPQVIEQVSPAVELSACGIASQPQPVQMIDGSTAAAVATAPDFPLVLREDGTPYHIGQDETYYKEPITVGYVHGGMLHEVMARSLVTMVRADSNIKLLLHESSCNLPLNRNVVMQRFLEADPSMSQWLLFIDSDISFPPYTAMALLKVAKETGADLVAAPYQLTNGCSTFAIAIEGGGYHTQGNFKMDHAYQIDGAGTGMMLISRSILEKVKAANADKEPWPFCGYDHVMLKGKPAYESEDYSLCRRIKEVGGKLVGYTGVCLGHMKVQPITFGGMEKLIQR